MDVLQLSIASQEFLKPFDHLENQSRHSINLVSKDNQWNNFQKIIVLRNTASFETLSWGAVGYFEYLPPYFLINLHISPALQLFRVL